MRKFVGKDAVELLFPYMQRLFSCHSEPVSKRDLDLSLEPAANDALVALSANPNGGLGFVSPCVQRVIYEKLSMLLICLNLEPEMVLSDEFLRCRSDIERLSLLLRGEAVSMNLRALAQTKQQQNIH